MSSVPSASQRKQTAAACARSRPSWRQTLACIAPVSLHRNGLHSSTPLQLLVATREDVVRAAHTLLNSSRDVSAQFGPVLYGDDGRIKALNWTPRGGEHIYAAPPFEPWFWPAHSPGHAVEINVDGRPLIMETIDVSPRVFRLRSFLTRRECQQIRSAAERQGWTASGSFDPVSGAEYDLAEGRRRSRTAWVGTEYGFRRSDVITSPLLKQLQHRAADAARMHLGHAEPWQVVKWRRGEQTRQAAHATHSVHPRELSS